MNEQAKTRKRNRRRGNSDGTVSKVPSKTGAIRWRWRLTLGFDADGHQKRVTGTLSSKAEAERALAEARVARDQGRLLLHKDITLHAFTDRWLQTKHDLADSTRHQYALYLRVYLPRELKEMQIQAIKLVHLQVLNGSMIEKKLGVALRRKVFSTIRAVLREAIAHELISVDPSASIRIRATTDEEQRRKRKKILQRSEFGRFFEGARNHHFYGLIYTMFSLGLRRGEALGLRWTDIDFENQRANIRQQVKLVGNKAEIGSLKTTSSKRTVAFGSDFLKVLREQRRDQEGWRDFCEDTWTETGLVFTTQVGTMIHPRNVNTAIARICRQLGMSTFSSHAGRHTHVSARLSQNEKLESVAAVVGHKNGQVTFEAYRHLFEEEEVAAPLNIAAFMHNPES